MSNDRGLLRARVMKLRLARGVLPARVVPNYLPRTAAEKTVFWFFYGTRRGRWVSAQDAKVVDAHMQIVGRIVERHAGQSLNCRCSVTPIRPPRG